MDVEPLNQLEECNVVLVQNLYRSVLSDSSIDRIWFLNKDNELDPGIGELVHRCTSEYMHMHNRQVALESIFQRDNDLFYTRMHGDV